MISSIAQRRLGPNHWGQKSCSRLASAIIIDSVITTDDGRLSSKGISTSAAAAAAYCDAPTLLSARRSTPAESAARTMTRSSEYRRNFHSSPAKQKWWNPFSRGAGAGGGGSSSGGSAIVSSSKTRGTGDSDDPRQLQERKDATLILLALAFRRLWQEQGRIAYGVYDEDHQGKIDREKIVDMAFDELEKEDLDSKTILQLRQTLQAALQDPVVEIFQHFAKVDETLPEPDIFSNSGTSEDGNADLKAYDSALVMELEGTVDQLANPTPTKAKKGADPKAFLALKRKAIETLMEKRQEAGRSRTMNVESTSEEEDEEETATSLAGGVAWVDADAFGYHETIDQEQNKQIRHYQAYNMARLAKLKAVHGYGVVALQSSLPGAGRGVYIDGFCPAGSIVAFQPGVVWSKEHLVSLPIEEERQLEKNDNYQMSLRPDDFMIDSRRSPYTVLANPWAVGHIVNHPTPAHPPNCRSVMVNFTSAMDLKKLQLESYVPNKYAKPRNLTLLGSLWEHDVVDMHGMCLVTTRDVCNEELFYDYRLRTPHRPSWYHTVQDNSYKDDHSDEEKKEKA